MTKFYDWLDFHWNSKWPCETLLEARILFSLAMILQAITLVVFLLFLLVGPCHAHDPNNLDNHYRVREIPSPPGAECLVRLPEPRNLQWVWLYDAVSDCWNRGPALSKQSRDE